VGNSQPESFRLKWNLLVKLPGLRFPGLRLRLWPCRRAQELPEPNRSLIPIRLPNLRLQQRLRRFPARLRRCCPGFRL
jgi:hypothetical protein